MGLAYRWRDGRRPNPRNRLFFFGGWEGQYQRTPQQFFFSVPTAALRAGDFSQAFNPDGSLQVIYDPATGNPDGTGRTPFPNNMVPAARFSEIAQQIQALYLEPNRTGELSNGNVAGEGIFRNYVRQQDRKFDRNNYDFKINYNLSPSNQIWGKASLMGATVTSPQAYLGYEEPSPATPRCRSTRSETRGRSTPQRSSTRRLASPR